MVMLLIRNEKAVDDPIRCLMTCSFHWKSRSRALSMYLFGSLGLNRLDESIYSNIFLALC